MKPTFDSETLADLRSTLQRHPKSFRLFLALCLNAIFAQVVYAAADPQVITRTNAYAIGLLGLVTVGLALYLLVVMFQPQRF